MSQNPCFECGACCVGLRIAFYWRECDDDTPGGVPLEFAQDLTSFYRMMKRTPAPELRCLALRGDPGVRVSCDIYERRPSVCREFPVSFENGAAEPRCDRARARHDLPPLRPQRPAILNNFPDIARKCEVARPMAHGIMIEFMSRSLKVSENKAS